MQRIAAAGFTLVEVLVALMVMAVMAAMAWQGVDGIVRARAASQARLEQTLRMNTVIAQWEQDLDAIQETRVLPSALNFDGAALRLTRRAPGGLQLVVWSLVPEEGSNVWLRWAGPVVTTSAALQDYWLRSQQFQGNEAGQLRTLSGISQWQMYCFVGNAWSNCQSTRKDPPAPGSAASAPQVEVLPSGVRLVLSFAPGSGQAGSLVRDTLLGL